MIDIIAVTYGHKEILKCFINSIKSQTDNKWRLYIIHDGINKDLESELTSEGYLTKDKIDFIQFPSRTGNYGHVLRNWGLTNLVKNDYVLITNGDNYYTPNMVELVLKQGGDFIYFDCVHSHNTPKNTNKSDYGHMISKLERGQIDMGSVVIKTNLAKSVGFNHIDFAADWHYFNEVLQKKPKISKIDKILLVHN
jgi:glycosyltransferase involved in cell wall biosynthesis